MDRQGGRDAHFLEMDMKLPIRRGDSIEILPQHQDPGDDKYSWVAIDDEEKGRVSIVPLGTGQTFPGISTVKVEWLK